MSHGGLGVRRGGSEIGEYSEAFGSVVRPGGTNGDIATLDRELIREELRRSGFVVLRGFGDASADGLARFGQRVCGPPVRHFQVDHHLRSSLTSNDVVVTTPTTLPSVLSWTSGTWNHLAGRRASAPDPLHAELAYSPARPDVVFFLAIRPSRPGRGGCTAICDGRALLRELSPDTVRLFRRKRLQYTTEHEEAPRWTLKSLALRKRRDDSQVLKYGYRVEQASPQRRRLIHVTDAIVRDLSGAEAFCNSILVHRGTLTFEDGSEIPGDVRAELSELSARIHVAHEYRANDVLMLDNSRFMHAGAWNTDPYRTVGVAMFNLS